MNYQAAVKMRLGKAPSAALRREVPCALLPEVPAQSPRECPWTA